MSTAADARPLVEVTDLVVRFRVGTGIRRGWITPVDHLTFAIQKGEALALVGESGSGKSTVARTLVKFVKSSSGTIRVDGMDITRLRRKDLLAYRHLVQMVFQDPFSSLNPLRTVEQHLIYPVTKHRHVSRTEATGIVEQLLSRVGLSPFEDFRGKYPHELSGGQRQRVGIARALAVDPKFIVADEPISMLDVSIRAEILQLLNDLKEEMQITYLYITHDLASAGYFGDRIMVLYGGRLMEIGPWAEVIQHPVHPYTRLLLASTPGVPRSQGAVEQSIEAPDLFDGRRGCPYAHRCPLVTEVCVETVPPIASAGLDHAFACHHPLQ